MTKSFRTLIGAPPSTATPTDSTLIIIDAQNEYSQGLLKTVNVEKTSSAIKNLLERYREEGGEVVHVVHKTSQEAPVFTGGSVLEGEMEGVEARGDEKAHVCVSTTARQAAELGYDVLLAEDAIGDRDIPGLGGEEVTKIALMELDDAFGTVVKSGDIK
ncbi:MAG: hypothetical protein M1830_010289 [Pleopsidium flavum]|nr:MAG: hypothetical protein M1830_010289 [Pleopsidium flavum]